MNEGEIRTLIRREIREAMAPIFMAMNISNESSSRSTIKRFSTEGPIPNTRNIQPYGFSSRAPANTPCFTIPVAGDPTHLIMPGHFDENKPTTNDGEAILYDQYGHIIYLSQTKMQFGSKSSANPMMLGDIVQTLLSQMLEYIATHVHVGNFGYDTSVPTNATDFTNLKASPVDDSKIISAKCYTEK